jgi:16S rRNA (cytidine1402-2'-O)-methyltransferase
MKGKLYLIPNTLGDSPVNQVIPAYNSELINSIHFYIVENVRTARRFLSKSGITTKIDDLQFFILNQHTSPEEFSQYLKPVLDGNNIGIISEAGCPAVADPGSEIVKMAHESDIEVVPLVGPSSIFLALMASGFNGQSFSFNGYLPIKQDERQSKIKKDEQRSKSENQTQIYIETPYRNNHLFDSLLATLGQETPLSIAADITLETEYIKTKTVNQWKKQKPDLNKRPTIFLFLAR